MGVHNGCVVQWMADGYEPVIGHHREEENVQFCKKDEKIHLGEAAFVGDAFVLDVDVQQHLWDGGGGETDV